MSKVRGQLSTVNCQPSTVRSGFTLIEMLIVIALIGILAAVLIGIINPGARQKAARDAIRKQHIVSIGQAAEAYYAENGNYPSQAQLTGGNNPYVRVWPTGDPGTGPNTYAVTTEASAASFCVQVGQEVYEDRFIRYNSSSGKVEENTAGC